MEIRYHLDENVDHAIANGLRRRGIDVTTANDAGLLGADDAAQLAFAASQRRVLVTHDDDFLRVATDGVAHAGIAYCPPTRRTIGQIVLTLAHLWRERTAESFEGIVEFL